MVFGFIYLTFSSNAQFFNLLSFLFLDLNPCSVNPCKSNEECMLTNEGGLGDKFVCLPNFCERMKPCNLNSECIYSKENNTFFCRCLNGAASCDELTETNVDPTFKTMSDRGSTDATPLSSAAFSSSSSSSSEVPTLNSNESNPDLSSSLTIEDSEANTAQGDTKPQSDIPKIGFNLDNVIK